MEHNGLRYDKTLINETTKKIIYKHLSDEEIKELHRVYAETVLKMLEIAPYVLSLPRVSIVRILENIISSDTLQKIKIELVMNGREFGTVEPEMLKRIKAFEKEAETILKQ